LCGYETEARVKKYKEKTRRYNGLRMNFRSEEMLGKNMQKESHFIGKSMEKTSR